MDYNTNRNTCSRSVLKVFHRATEIFDIYLHLHLYCLNLSETMSINFFLAKFGAHAHTMLRIIVFVLNLHTKTPNTTFKTFGIIERFFFSKSLMIDDLVLQLI